MRPMGGRIREPETKFQHLAQGVIRQKKPAAQKHARKSIRIEDNYLRIIHGLMLGTGKK